MGGEWQAELGLTVDKSVYRISCQRPNKWSNCNDRLLLAGVLSLVTTENNDGNLQLNLIIVVAFSTYD